MENEIESRSYDTGDSELRATRRGRTIEGRAIVFNKESKDLGGFKEIIDPSAIEGIFEKADVLALLDHNENRGVLARCTNLTGSMEITVDNKGVNYRFEAPDTPLGDEVLSGIRRGDIRTSSFKFRSLPNDPQFQKWEKRSDGTYVRRIKKFVDIVDFSPVYREAYQDTTCAVRSLIEEKTKEDTAEATQRIADLEEELRKLQPPSESTNVAESVIIPDVKPEDLTEYYKELRKKITRK
jgi:HK97 family phage prohead protease